MIVKKLRAAAAALMLGTAAVAGASIVCATQAEAAVRPQVGKPLQEAQALAGQGNYQAAMAKVNQAAAVGGLTAEEQKIIAQMRDYISVKSGGAVGVSSAAGAQAKFDTDYRNGKFRDAINDEQLLRKYGAMNAQNAIVIGQAYYNMADYRGCVRYAADHSSLGQDMLKLQLRCAYQTGDDRDMRQAAEALVATAPTPENWNQLLNLAERSKALSDPQSLDIYRLKYLTGTMQGAGDYFTLAQLLIAANLSSEASSVIEKGMQAHILVDQRAQRLLAMSKSRQAGDVATIQQTAAKAQKASSGDLLIQLGDDYNGMGRYPDAIAAIVAGIKKGVHDPDAAQTALARAYFGAGQKAAALAALAKADKTDNGRMIAHLWSLYMRAH
jgi:hypothetical protein